MRDAQTLAQIRLDYYRKIENIKILQYFFYMQWRGLKEYANKQKSNSKNTLLKSYDLFLNKKYDVVLNQKTIERVKNFFQ